jgi:methylmalonyl-CoA mutase
MNAAPVHLGARPGRLGPALLLPEFSDVLRETRSEHDDVFGGTVTYDPVAALAAGSLRDPRTAFDLAGEVVAMADDVPLRTLAVDARIYHEAGASAVQELAFTLAALTEIFDQCTERGYTVDALCALLHVVTSVDTSYFVEIGKLRALRLLVARVLSGFLEEAARSAANVDAPADRSAAIHPSEVYVQAQTSGRTQTVYGPHVNMLRGSTEAASAIIGGCDVLSVAPFDSAFREPSEFSNRIARNTQLILRHESHLDQVADPSAGSYYIEAITDELISEAWSLFQEIEAEGGMLAALQRGDIAERIDRVRAERTERVDQRRHALVGTSHYPDIDETRLDDLEEAFDRGGRSAADAKPADVDAATADIADRLRGQDAVLDASTEAFRDGESLFAISAALASIIDAEDPSPIPLLSPLRLGAPFEALRLRTERYANRTGRRPTVLLAPHGPAGPRSARSNFARNVLGVAGFRIVEPIAFDDAEEAVDAAVDEGADVVVACSSDDVYADYVPALRTALTDAESRALLVVAGSPETIGAPVTDVADRFVHLKASLIDTLQRIQLDIGIVEP